MATMFLKKPIKPQGIQEAEQGHTHCKVGTIPLTPCPSPGVAAGVVGVTPLPMFEASTPFCSCWPFGYAPPVAWVLPSFSEGGVSSPAPPGKDNEAGEVKAVACCAVDGCVVSVSMLAIEYLRGGAFEGQVQ